MVNKDYQKGAWGLRYPKPAISVSKQW